MAAAATSVLSLYGGSAFADSQADGTSRNSAGVLSGNTVQVPVEVPVNACGNTVDGAAALNPAFGNKCANVSEKTPKPTPTPSYGNDCDDQGGYGDQSGYGGEGGYGNQPGDCTTPPPKHTPPPPTRTETPPRVHTPPAKPPQMAETGSANTGAMLATSAASAALIAGGVVLYRRGRTTGSHR